MKILTSPERGQPDRENSVSIFLAGSIEMGTAENWQERVLRELKNAPCTVYNPRRVDWDPSWVQDISNPQFNEQVNWELDYLENADIVLMVFDPATKSPITLMELGFLAAARANGAISDVIVVCPPGFWRRGNVQIICDRGEIDIFDSLDAAMSALHGKIGEWEFF